MIASRIKKRLDSDIVRLPNVGHLIGKNVEIIVIEDEESEQQGSPLRQPRVSGLAKGLFKTSDDFSVPLAEDMIEDFEK